MAKKKLVKEAVLLSLFGVLLFLGLSRFGAYEIYEIAAAFLTLLTVFSVFAFLHWQDTAKLNKKLKAKQAQLVQSAKLASLGEMATGIAHELNQPLTFINLTTETLLAQFKNGMDKEFESYCNQILQQIDHAAHITNHLRMFGRDASQEVLKNNDLNQIIENTVILVNTRLKNCDIEIHKQLSALPLFECNAIQIEQVLLNLINNAKDALANTKGTITVRSLSQGNRLIVEIEDTGPGIPKENQNKIFDSFFTTKAAGCGTGLGLSISRSIVHDHGGTLELESEPGKGALFRIKFPVA